MAFLKNGREFRDPIVFDKRDAAVPITEYKKKVIDCRVVLLEKPDFTNHVAVYGYYTSYAESSPLVQYTFYEVFDSNAILAENQFRVNYTDCYVEFHPSKEGLIISQIDYFGWGNILIPADRVLLHHEENPYDAELTLQDIIDNNREIIEAIGTVQDVLDLAEQRAEAFTTPSTGIFDVSNELIDDFINANTGIFKQAEDKKNELNTTMSNADLKKTDLDGSIESGNTKKVELQNKIDEAQGLINNLGDSVTLDKKVSQVENSLYSKSDKILVAEYEVYPITFFSLDSDTGKPIIRDDGLGDYVMYQNSKGECFLRDILSIEDIGTGKKYKFSIMNGVVELRCVDSQEQ